MSSLELVGMERVVINELFCLSFLVFVSRNALKTSEEV